MQTVRKKPAFDRSVMMTFIVVSLIGILISGYKLITYQDCTLADFTTIESAMIAGKVISFQDLTPGAKEWEWDFGDKSPVSTERRALHVYEFPGEYWVSLQVNDKCQVRKKITVYNNAPLVDSSNYPRFNAPLTARVGEKVQFLDNTPGAKKWQWSFGETRKIDASGQAPVYVYRSPGTKTITLVVNGKTKYAATRRITIFSKPVRRPRVDLSPPANSGPEKAEEDKVEVTEVPLPPPIKPAEETPKAPQISRVQFEEWLLQISEEKRDAGTLSPYCCSGMDQNARVNGKSSTLRKFCEEIRGKKIVIESLELIKDEDTGCINFISIDYKRKRALGIF